MNIDIEERVAKAKRLFKEEGYNCCQAVVLAYNDVFGIEDAVAAAMSSGFGGGMGRMREVCGSVSGMVMLAGLMAPANDPSIKVDRTRNYALVQEMAGKLRPVLHRIGVAMGSYELARFDRDDVTVQATVSEYESAEIQQVQAAVAG